MLIVEFASGYERYISDARCLDVFHANPDDGWWTEITESQNPSDLSDTPAAVAYTSGDESFVPLGRVELDADGEWVTEFNSWPIWTPDEPTTD